MTTALRSLARVVVLGLLALVVVLATGTDARAHTRLESADPADGSTVTGPLAAVTLTFGGAVRVDELLVTGPSGAESTTGAATSADGVVTQPVALSEPGPHTVRYAVTSDDGHRVTGSIAFTHAPPATSPPPPAPTTASTTPAPAPTPAPSEAASERPAAASSAPAWLAGGGAVALTAAVVVGVRRARR